MKMLLLIMIYRQSLSVVILPTIQKKTLSKNFLIKVFDENSFQKLDIQKSEII